MEWISVEDRLPEIWRQIVIAYNGEDVEPCYYTRDFVPLDYEYVDWNVRKVTHWMPLPEPPNGE